MLSNKKQINLHNAEVLEQRIAPFIDQYMFENPSYPSSNYPSQPTNPFPGGINWNYPSFGDMNGAAGGYGGGFGGTVDYPLHVHFPTPSSSPQPPPLTGPTMPKQ